MTDTIIEVKDINKAFPGVNALSNFSFELRSGEVHSLVGENGAGKSTFIKILSGAYHPDNGVIRIESQEYTQLNPALARSLGIQTVYQEAVLIPQISAAENIFLGIDESKRKIFMNYKEIMEKAEDLCNQYGISFDVKTVYEELSPSDQQFTKILKSLALQPKVLILDEPTAVFNIADVKLVTDLVKEIRKKGVGVIYITHHLDEVMEISDRVTVLRDGQKVDTHTIDTINEDKLATEMVGRPVELFYKKRQHTLGEMSYEVKNLNLPYGTSKINFYIRKGEILGLAGLKGSGRTEIVRAIFGADPIIEGKVFKKGVDVTPKSPKKAVSTGISLLTEDKKANGLCLNMSVASNISLVGLNKLGGFFIDLQHEKESVQEYVKQLNIKTPSLSQEVRFLSGGNQQKVVLAKWLFKGVDLLIVDEPTQGIDVSAKVEVYDILSELAEEGKSILMISSDMPELIALSDRVLVISNFSIVKELTGTDITEDNILQGFIGGNSG